MIIVVRVFAFEAFLKSAHPLTQRMAELWQPAMAEKKDYERKYDQVPKA